MISHARQSLGGLLAALWLLGGAYGVAAQSADIDSTSEDLDRLVRKINEIEKDLSNKERQRAQWELDLQDEDQAVARIGLEVEEAAEQLAATNRAIAEVEAEQQQLETKRIDQAQKIAEHLAASYRMSGEDYVKLLLNQRSPEQLNRLMRYHRYFTEARMAVIDDYQVTLDAMADNRFRLETQREDAEAKQRELAERQRNLGRQRKSREAMIAELNAQVEGQSAELRRLNNDRKRLEALLAELKRRSTELDGDAFAARKGSLPWPLKGRLVNAFGASRADGRLSWTGVVIAADEGDPVKAVFRGRVVFANSLRGFGLLTIIDHGGGYLSLYGHADMLMKTEGEWVESGETIARAGNSGAQVRTGLYFEVRHNGVARDPIGWLAKR